MNSLALSGISMLLLSNAWAGDANHASSLDCGDIWYDIDYEPPSPKSLDDLDPAARQQLNAHLAQRLGPEYAAKLSLTGGQRLDRKQLLEKVP